MGNPAHYVMWNMTRQCNYRCEYCYYPHVPPPVRHSLDREALLRFLDDSAERWLVGMTGGEPFLYPDFIGLCQDVTRRHMISVDTNLSLPRLVRDFAERLDPARVQELYISLHIQERERTGGVGSFIESMHLLRERGFNLIVNYVLHPDLVRRFEQDKSYFAGQDIELRPRPFKGVHQGRRFPESYCREGQRLLALHPGAGAKMVYNFYGVPCNGGRTFIRMEPDGTVYRCSGEKTVLGNIERGIRLHDEPQPCRTTRCPCQGLEHVMLNQSQEAFLRGLHLGLIGQSREAREAYAQVLELDPAHAGARNNTGVLLWQENMREQALEFFSSASEQYPEDGVFICNRAIALANQGRGSEARQVCVEFLQRHQDSNVLELSQALHNGSGLSLSPRLCMRVQPAPSRCAA